jgi:ligand-binding sensor domain-containing protein
LIDPKLDRMIIRCIVFTFLVCFHHVAWGQLLPQSSYKLFNTNNGLPSTQIQGLFEDSRHFIWAITDRGVARFDGYRFQVYSTRHGLPTNNVLLINEDRKGRIWMMCNTGEYCYMEGDSIYPFQGNNKIKGMLRDRLPGPFYFDEQDTLWVTTFSGIQLFKCYQDSVVEEYKPAQDGEAPDAMYYLRRVGEKMLTLQIGEVSTANQIVTNDNLNYLLTLAGECKLACSVRVDEHKWAVAGPGGYVVFDEGGSIITHYSTSPYIFSTLEHDRLGRLWLTNSNGAYLLDNYNTGPAQSTVFFEGHFISAMLQDRQGNYWFGDRDNGIFFVPDLETQVVKDPVVGKQNKIVSIQQRNNAIYYTDAGGKLYQYQDSAVSIITDEDVPSGVTLDFAALPTGGFLVGNKPIVMNDQGRVRTQVTTNSTMRKTFVTTNGDVMIALSDGLARYSNGQWQTLHAESFKERSNVVYQRKDGSIWIGTNKGVYKYEETGMIPLKETQAAPLRVVDILEWNNVMLMATRQHGLAVWNGSALSILGEGEGLVSNTIDCLMKDPTGGVWIGSSLGLQQLVWNAEFSSFKPGRWITTANGLPSNEINDMLLVDDQTMLVATNDGMVILRTPWVWQGAAKPIVSITAIQLGNEIRSESGPIELTSDQNDLKISFLSFNFRMGSLAQYRYRLVNLQNDWVVTSNTSAEFWALDPGKYVFEVQSVNEDGQWSESATLPVTVHPHFAQTWWFRGLVILFVVLAIIAFMRWRYMQKQKTFEQRAKVAELKQQALNANMNPHFIFNALNSIQHLVLTNKTLEANEYLTDFSQLIRMNLEGNLEQLITLEEEFNRLELYLKLEKLRFGSQLDFVFENRSSLYPGNLEIPPMFLQPYVENSIIHGILPGEHQGMIHIALHDHGDSYAVEIRDNGIGLKASALNKKPGHNSMATRINAERMEILRNWTGQRFEFAMDEEINNDGKVLGVRVLVSFPKDIALS